MFKRFSVLLIMMVLLTSVFTPSLATTATPVSLDSIYATCEIPKAFTTVLTPENLSAYESWLVVNQKNLATLQQDFKDRHVLVQAWNSDMDVCLEITATQDSWAEEYFDLEAQTSQVRSNYRNEHLNDTLYPGYSYDSAEWQKSSTIGRFLMLKYSFREDNKLTHRGYARRTIRNGYTITVDVQVFGRKLKGADNNLLNSVMDSWVFTQTLPLPTSSAANMVLFTQPPPSETNTGIFSVKGSAEPESTIIAVLSSWTRNEQVTVEGKANKEGNFSLDIELPFESLFVMSLTAITQTATHENLLVHTITYDKTMLPVSFLGDFSQAAQSSDMRMVTNEEKVVLEGLSMKGAKIQLLYDGKNIKKTVGGNQSFSFSIPTKEEREYDITISFSTKSLSEKRYRFTVVREFTPSQKIASIKDEAVKPSYGNLVDKLDGYTGRKMVYTLYPLAITPSDEEGQWIIKVAFASNKNGFKDFAYVISDNQPSFTIENPVQMYLDCLGGYDVDEDGKVTTYPYFQFLFAE
ncbi:MAG: hypothetical protein GX786_02155 [Clostridiales bacterium]|nr:hypothetical protein [Clostridiales bacterium]